MTRLHPSHSSHSDSCDARDAILKRIEQALDGAYTDHDLSSTKGSEPSGFLQPQAQGTQARLDEARRAIDLNRRATALERPQTASSRVDTFVNMAIFSGADVVLSDRSQLLDDLLQTLVKHDAAQLPVTASQSALDFIGEAQLVGSPLLFSQGAGDVNTRIGLTLGYAGVAETGSVCVLSSSQQSTLLNFLPEMHLIVLDRSSLVDVQEDVFDWLKSDYSDYAHGVLPRNLVFITGPSRSADIEQTLILGAHGPRSVVIFLV